MQTVPKREASTYRCKICNFENVSKKMAQSNVPVTKLGNYGDNATPTPTTYSDTVYSAKTISFVASAGSDPAYLSDYALGFADNHIQCNWNIEVTTTSGTNDGSYTIADRGVSRGTILLESTGKRLVDSEGNYFVDSEGNYLTTSSLSTESAATAGTVTIKKVIYQPTTIMSGCPFCDSLASR